MRLAHPKTCLEAITSRPMLLAGVARLTQHAGQSRLLLTLTHAAGDQIRPWSVSYTHLDVYKRQPDLKARLSLAGRYRPQVDKGTRRLRDGMSGIR